MHSDINQLCNNHLRYLITRQAFFLLWYKTSTTISQFLTRSNKLEIVSLTCKVNSIFVWAFGHRETRILLNVYIALCIVTTILGTSVRDWKLRVSQVMKMKERRL